jgi:hypothetical protein
MSDVVRVVEAAYDLDAPDESTWLSRLSDAARAELGFESGVVAYSFDIRAEDGWITPGAMALSGAPGELAQDLLSPGESPEEQRLTTLARTHATSGASLASRAGGAKSDTDPRFRSYFQRVLRGRGFEDALVLNATDPTRRAALRHRASQRAQHLRSACAHAERAAGRGVRRARTIQQAHRLRARDLSGDRRRLARARQEEARPALRRAGRDQCPRPPFGA